MSDEADPRDAIRKAAEAHTEYLEKELRGAWRAGYDYLHVYSKPKTSIEELSLVTYVLPSNDAPPRPPSLTYDVTYDLASVPDDVIRKMIEQRAGIGVEA